MRISDWSSDVCSSDLAAQTDQLRGAFSLATGAERYAAIEQLWSAGGSTAQSYAAMVATARAAAALSPSTETGDDPWQLLGSMLAGGFDKNALDWAPAVSVGSHAWGGRPERRREGIECVGTARSWSESWN